uniref:Uncharacterized protein n=1 Tax=Glyptapanteles indiensis TaxID=92994 RepID=B7S936_GLYIN|nr:hypothetical protein GIP_L8_0250 [Glyptapanteles indiensis]
MSITIHRDFCLVPRRWLGFDVDSLEVLLCKVIGNQFRSSEESAFYSLRIEGVSARLRYYNGHAWMQRVEDDNEVPEITEYYALFIPCAHCTEFN